MNQGPNGRPTVTIAASTYAFAMRELEESHAALDRLGVARMAYDAKLSLSQRMAIVEKDVAHLSLVVNNLREAKGVAAQ